ncbi:MAG: hypothetical protein JWP57_4476 [Spirosoma sp.]|nr:hypothetical protein [Spirosoma sp.]
MHSVSKKLGLLAGAALLLTGCGGQAGTAAATSGAPTAAAIVQPTATATPSAAAAPAATSVPTSGSYAADVSKLGVLPDSMDSYIKWTKGQICEKEGTALGVAVRLIGGGTPSSGGGPEVVRLTVAYFCPEKSQEVEEALEYYKQ